MPAPIVVEVYSPQPRPQELAVLISACSRAAAPNECVSPDERGSEPPLGVAIVRRDGDRARIELGLRGVTNAEWSTRDLLFQPNDDELERYRAIGFAIGTLVSKRLEPVAAPEPPKPEQTSAPRTEQARPVLRRESARLPLPPRSPTPRSTWVDLAAAVGLGLVPGPPRAGAMLRAASELAPAGFFGLAETGYAERVGEPGLRVRWLSLALGLGHPLGPRLSSLGFEARLQLVLERLSLTAVSGERSDAASRWKPGIAGGIDAHWDVAPPLALLVSASSLVDPQRTVIRTAGARVGETPALGLSGFVGLRLKLR